MAMRMRQLRPCFWAAARVKRIAHLMEVVYRCLPSILFTCCYIITFGNLPSLSALYFVDRHLASVTSMDFI